MGLFKNYVEIIGNLGDAPKYILSQQNQPRFTFDICTNKPYKEGNEWKSKSTWVKCTAWGNLATALSRMSFAQAAGMQAAQAHRPRNRAGRHRSRSPNTSRHTKHRCSRT